MNQEESQFYDYRNVSNNYPIQEDANRDTDNNQMKKMSENYLHHYVTGHMTDGRVIEGIIVDVDDEAVTILVAEKDDHTREEDSRQFGRVPGFFRFRPFRFPFRFFRRPFITPFIFPFFWI
jgi:hypothetical protein